MIGVTLFALFTIMLLGGVPIAVALGLAGATAIADRSQLPAVSGLTALDFPAIERTTLRNGIEVVFARRTAVPTVQVAVSFDAGYAADPRSALGTQSLMLSLLPEGTTSRSSVQIAEENERLGSSIQTVVSRSLSGISGIHSWSQAFIARARAVPGGSPAAGRTHITLTRAGATRVGAGAPAGTSMSTWP